MNGFETVTIHVPLSPPAAAVMVTWPADNADTIPDSDTAAIEELDELHETELFVASDGMTEAVNNLDSPMTKSSVRGVTLTFVTGITVGSCSLQENTRRIQEKTNTFVPFISMIICEL